LTTITVCKVCGEATVDAGPIEIDCLVCALNKENACADCCRDWDDEEGHCGNSYTDLWVQLKYTIEGSEYCKQIREVDSSPAFGSALCNKCIEKECKFSSICVELHEMNKEDNE